MDTEVLVAVIGLLTAGAGMIAAWFQFGQPRLRARQGRRYREAHKIPDVLGWWSATWKVLERDHEGAVAGAAHPPDQVYTEDDIQISRWGPGYGEFQGVEEGRKQQADGVRKIDYVVWGEVGSGRIVTLHWRHRDYPRMGHMGSAILHLRTDGKTMEGYWIGMIEEDALAEGAVTLVHQSQS